MEDKALDVIVQEKIDADTDFQASLEGMSDEDKDTAVNNKRKEVTEEMFKEVSGKATTFEKIAGDQKIRAEKAETDLKKVVPPKKKEDDKSETPELSTTDLYALMQSDIAEEDVEEVVKASKLLGKTIKETLGDPTLKAILKTRVEERATADATNTGKNRPGAKKVSDQELMDNAAKGVLPEPGSPEADQLFWARRGKKPR